MIVERLTRWTDVEVNADPRGALSGAVAAYAVDSDFDRMARSVHRTFAKTEHAGRILGREMQSACALDADSLATTAHRDWERALAQPLATQGDFHWTPAYASELADATRRALGAGGLQLPARLLLLWRQRLGVAAVIGMLDAHVPFRRILVDLIGTGRKALR